MRAALALALLLTGCGRSAGLPADHSPGDALEHAARAAGLIADPGSGSLVGAWSRDTDRACIVPARDGAARIGILVDYGEGQGCAASGTVERRRGGLDVRLGACRIRARFDGQRISFPATLGAACDAACTGRASLAALSVERQSESASEASMLRAPSGRSLCPTD